ncbi:MULTISPECIES: LysR family transcriptional regulator [Pseudomonadota]|jgi:DNA-binding transcriptional LysR family regulator|uniref:Transcriptional regulator, LysR family n=1 Tax=Chelativorans sp. (strain BNC1) TaxID=266779 RepID=Q11H84_CHESB|nr:MULTISPECIES: LysR family transcriptional regulator [Chelativorans]
MNLRSIPVAQLLELLAVVRCGSINRAAQELNTTQPTLTRSIKRLEDRLRVPLLQRTAHGVTPSEYTKAMLPFLQSIESDFRKALAEIEAATGAGAGKICIGSTAMVANKIVPQVLARFVPRWPHLTIEFVEDRKPALLEGLRSGKYDFVMALMSPEEQARDILQQELFTDTLVVIARPGHPLTKLSSLSVRDIVQCKWILPTEGLDLRSRLENFFRNEGHDVPAFPVETTLFTAIVALVKSTDRISAIPSVVVRDELLSGELVALRGPWNFIHRSFSAYFRRGHTLSPSARELFRETRRYITELGVNVQKAAAE